VVRAELNFNEESTESESYDPATAIALREQTIDETYSGTGAPPGGTLGVDGEEVIETEEGEGYTYDRSEVIREYGIDRVVTRSVVAPGQVEQLSVAVVMDDGSLTGFPVPPVSEIEALITAAVGLDVARGDSISVSAVAFPPAAEVADGEAAAAASPLDVMSLIPQLIGGLVLLIVAVALMLMSRGGKKPKKSEDGEVPSPAALPAGGSRELAAVGAAATNTGLHPEVMTLVQKQPEEIAVLLRSWLADRR
jgi:flagellar M-ring protein FliF